MEPFVYILGTSHRYQFRDSGIRISEHQRFDKMIRQYVKDLDICGIAEECNHEALANLGIQKSSVEDIAAKLSLPHHYCDPDMKTRNSLGIYQENRIRALAHLHDEELSEEVIQRRTRESLIRREHYWANELKALNIWPVLFVCGANHAQSFATVLDIHGLIGVIKEQDWGA